MSSVADFLRSQMQRIAERWEEEVRADLPALSKMTKPVLFDHLPEFLDGLADWIDGNPELAEVKFARLAEGHALQRLGYGVGLETLTREYSKLRVVLLRLLNKLEPTQEVREDMVTLHEGMDRAINEAMHRYATRRDEVRERFVAILGHDLRDPLSTVVISANMLAANPSLKPEHRVVASRIVRACDRMQRMISDVMDFARGHLGNGIPANPTLNDMGEILRAAADEISGANPQREVAIDTQGDLRGAFDRDRVHQALTNLISNAVNHGEGRIEVRAFETEDHHAVITEVTSHGEVIPEPLRERLFDPFAQGEIAGPRRGLGLGLFIVQQIAIAHGALCEVTSNEQGTTFRIRWPRVPGHERRMAATG
ncbi:MAG TPA: HAMP domain-containing sensor histidine kinase [Kofleriaceae bacterium]|jgi:signal transduction histidine kinase|nr:HAMP domain-containing sensor histidine kinase [Kofleriaceae bacterium]